MSRETWILLLIVTAFSGVLAFRALRGPAPTPAVFDQQLTLDEAIRRSGETGRPVLAVATADWCGPCQALKRGALADEAVASLLRERTIPVYLEDGADRDAIASLGVRAYPTTVLIRDGHAKAVLEGGASPGAYRAAIEDALDGRP